MLSCPICHSNGYKTVSMGNSIVSGYVCSSNEDSLSQPIFNVQLNLCTNCSTLFQKIYQKAEEILNIMYTQHEATIRSSEQYSSYYEYFANNVARAIDSLDRNAKILEIGCNDGLLLGLIGTKCKATLYGVEPSVKFKDIWKERSVTGTIDFFGAETAVRMKECKGTMDVVIARHVLEHISNPHDFFEGLRVISDKETIIFIEVPYLTSIFQLGRFENVSYSHLVHYSVKSMIALAGQYNFLVADYNLCDIDGGAVVFQLRQSGAGNVVNVKSPQSENDIDRLFAQFKIDFEESKAQLLKYLDEHNGKALIGFGAGAKGQFLIHLYGLQTRLSAVIDETPGYARMLIPGTTVPIVGLDYLEKFVAATVINLAPTHSQVVKTKIPKQFTFIDPVNKIY